MDRTAARGCSPLRQARARWVTRPARRRTVAGVSMNASEAPWQGRRQLRDDHGLRPLRRKAHLSAVPNPDSWSTGERGDRRVAERDQPWLLLARALSEPFGAIGLSGAVGAGGMGAEHRCWGEDIECGRRLAVGPAAFHDA
jgi:hypothetical protein